MPALAEYLPEGAYAKIAPYLIDHKVHLTITRQRQSVLGDYRHPDHWQGHRITVNGNLNPYNFLLTLVHEIAHLVAFTRYGHSVSPHGREWKAIYRELLSPFLGCGCLPSDVEAAVRSYIKNPRAASCSDDELIRVLRRYDRDNHGRVLVEEMPEGALFRTPDGRIFRRMQRLRKRYHCIEVKTKKAYLFSPVYEVIPLDQAT
ncbi:SprT-like domain-containing protein [Compostibacter hankyongensis]|uniref:SprT-like domain-containing protein n=1 Tax=Compostibacter hankyongensis TaxID=1007089 RepID=A0ABP8GAS7_9BACT